MAHPSFSQGLIFLELKTQKGITRCDLLIGADGRQSNTRTNKENKEYGQKVEWKEMESTEEGTGSRKEEDRK